MSKIPLAVLLGVAIGSADGFDTATYSMGRKGDNSSKYPFTDEEKEKLAGLQGKEKKRFVKELKLKYKKLK